MAYLIEGKNRSLFYCANYRVGSVATANTLLNMGAHQTNGHHGHPSSSLHNAVIAQTVRSHFDVIVSFWFKDGGEGCFTKYVERILDGHHRYLRPEGFYGKFKWDYVLNYRTLQYEFDQLCDYVGLPQTMLDEGPKNKSTKPPQLRSESLFSSKLQAKIHDRYGEELEKIGYGTA